MDVITKLKTQNDAELGKTMGHPQEIAAMRDLLERADKLDAEARKRVIFEIDERLAPRLSTGAISWKVESAEREAKAKLREIDNCDPASVCADCED